MMNGQSESSFRLYGELLVLLSLVGTCILPSITISDGLPKIEISDVTFPLLLLLTTYKFRKAAVDFIFEKRSLYLLLALILIIIVSIFWNHRWQHYRDWFEPMKIFKVYSFIFFFYFFLQPQYFMKFFRGVFLMVVAFNVLHYFNIMEFNRLIEPYYSPPHHLDFFGLNSIGEPDTKRMLGVLGNPNNNAIFFLASTLILLPKKNETNSVDLVLSLISILCVLACQSRTGMLALILLLGLYFVVIRPTSKIKWIIVAGTVGGYLLLTAIGNSYLGSMADPGYLRSAGVGRLTQWKRIIASMPGSWVLGHAPSKEYFESRGIYAESEYFLLLFRYGVVGVITLLAFWAWLVRSCAGSTSDSGKMLLWGIVLIFAFAGLTNSPLHSTKLSVILALILGMSLFELDGRKKV